VREEAGRGGTEVLCWTAAFAALSMGGPFVVEQSFYEAIPGWIAGFATMAARKAEAAR
jgi:2,3-dihydroxyphenylpropionate 1,2-dioxygenase